MTPIRARDLGLPFDGTPGPFNAITDVAGVAVGFRTVIEDTPRPGRHRLVRSGVTAIVPHAGVAAPLAVWAGHHRFNGNGEMTGTHWIADGGWFLGPVVLTNTHAVGIAHHAVTGWMIRRWPGLFNDASHHWAMPVVAETYDGVLNDIHGRPLTEADVLAALEDARTGAVAEGNVGGGTGMIAYGFKGGTGTASRVVRIGGRDHVVAALVQANHGMRDWLTVCGVAVGRQMPQAPDWPLRQETGSIIVVIATDAPLAPHQLQRLARRGAIGIGRGGTVGGNNSGDIFLAFSTANPRALPDAATHRSLEILADETLDAVYEAAIQSVEEAVINAMVAARPMGGTVWDAHRVEAIDHAALAALLRP